jgi:hypothetical protein
MSGGVQQVHETDRKILKSAQQGRGIKIPY